MIPPVLLEVFCYSKKINSKRVFVINQIRNFMYGRYGIDQFSIALLLLSILISILLRSSILWYMIFISYIPLGFAIFRTFSTNIEKRYQENQKFLKYWRRVTRWFYEKNKIFKDHQTYKYFKCPRCKQKLRAPRGKGKIQVTCQACSHKFIKKV